MYNPNSMKISKINMKTYANAVITMATKPTHTAIIHMVSNVIIYLL